VTGWNLLAGYVFMPGVVRAKSIFQLDCKVKLVHAILDAISQWDLDVSYAVTTATEKDNYVQRLAQQLKARAL
jgi:hypothetical protein